MITRSEVGTHDGYRFVGWQGTGIVGTETEYILIPTGTVGNLEYYEVWQKIIYGISYELNGGTNSLSNPTTYISGYTVILEDPTYGIYTFAGWYLDSGFTNGPIHEISSNMSGDIKLYAKWLMIRVIFEPNGGIGDEMEPLQGHPITPRKSVVPLLISSSALPAHTPVPCDKPEMITKSENVFGLVASRVLLVFSVPNSGRANAPVFTPK